MIRRPHIGCGCLAVLLLLMLSGVISDYFDVRRVQRRVTAVQDLKLLTICAQVYAVQSMDRMPEARNWCDLLTTPVGTNSEPPLTWERLDKMFARSRCGFAINREWAGQPLDSLPEDAVVFLPVNARGTNLVANPGDLEALWWDGRNEMPLVTLNAGERAIRRPSAGNDAPLLK